MVESSGLLNRRRALKLYRGFESLPLRQFRISGIYSRIAADRKMTTCNRLPTCHSVATRPQPDFAISPDTHPDFGRTTLHYNIR